MTDELPTLPEPRPESRTIIRGPDGYARGVDAEVEALTHTADKLRALLWRLEPHIDALVCYASTTTEHSTNQLALDVRAALGAPVPVGLPAGEQTGPVAGAPTPQPAEPPPAFENARTAAEVAAAFVHGMPEQPARKPLTDEEVEAGFRSHSWSEVPHPFRGSVGFERGVRFAERAHGIGTAPAGSKG